MKHNPSPTPKESYCCPKCGVSFAMVPEWYRSNEIKRHIEAYHPEIMKE
jgi:hypothetical protein